MEVSITLSLFFYHPSSLCIQLRPLFLMPDPSLEFLQSFDVVEFSNTLDSSSSTLTPSLNTSPFSDGLAFDIHHQPTSDTFPEQLEDDDAETENTPAITSTRIRWGKGKGASCKVLPDAPIFNNIFSHAWPVHKAYGCLPWPLQQLGDTLSPLKMFTLFFSDSTLQQLAKNTNAYAGLHHAGEHGRKWQDTTSNDLHIFITLLIYMGVYCQPVTSEYWSSLPSIPQHTITQHMTLTCFEQLKWYLHVSDPTQLQEAWCSKMEPLASELASKFHQFYTPSTNVSIDEMIICFSGRSAHTIQMKAKPTPEGYKIFAICNAGYTYGFLFSLRVHSIHGIQPIPGLTTTAAAIVHLAKMLPYSLHAFNIYMDNYFSSIPLFKHLCSLQIRAYGTVCINSGHYPSDLKVSKAEKLQWNIISGEVVDNEVLAAVWVDNAPVTMLTTIHQITGTDSLVLCDHCCPHTTSTNAQNVQQIFNGQPRALLNIPKVIDNYNFNMNGVDVSDQYRSYYSTQLTVYRTWMPFFFWILDTAIVNAYRLHHTSGGTLSHKDFWVKLAWALIKEAICNKNVKRPTRNEISDDPKKNTKRWYFTQACPDLNPLRLSVGMHLPYPTESRLCCDLCQYKATVQKNPSYKAKTQSSTKCKLCDAVLCYQADRNCFTEYHTQKEF